MSEIDRRATNVILALSGLELGEFAEHVGYDAGYVSNVLTEQTRPSPAFRRAFGEAVATLIFGDAGLDSVRLPATPLLELVKRHARYAPSKRDFYSDHGINMNYLVSRQWLSGALVDRICCALGVHPSAIYGSDVREAS